MIELYVGLGCMGIALVLMVISQQMVRRANAKLKEAIAFYDLAKSEIDKWESARISTERNPNE